MTQMAHADLHAQIDHSIAYLTAEWSVVPEVAAEWAAWDEHDRLDSVIEWPIREDRLALLRRWAAQGRMSSAQATRYEALETLVALHRGALERLVAD